jgi:hypothetical protein
VKLQELDFAAVTNLEVTQALKDISSNLKAPLAEIEMHPPIINEFGEVKPPHRDGSMPIEETKAASKRSRVTPAFFASNFPESQAKAFKRVTKGDGSGKAG